MTAVERFQERVVKMIGEGFRGFHFTAGPKWETMTTEERCASILEMWDAPKTLTASYPGPMRANREAQRQSGW